ncbi:hypothetical protein LSAT2_019368 [Lamellibrachia satsuma]|nr:hypothetical protein LSAT2_019368 [Lamellibrachia satsuma]
MQGIGSPSEPPQDWRPSCCVLGDGLVRCSDSPCYHNAKCKDLSDSEDEPSVKCTCAALYGGRYCEGVNKTIIYSGSATISLLLAMCLGIWYYRRRQKMKRLEHEQLQRRVEAERRRKSKGPKSRAMKKLFKPLEQLPWDVGL